MKLSMRRIVLFTKDMPGMTAFYRDVLGLRLLKDEERPVQASCAVRARTPTVTPSPFPTGADVSACETPQFRHKIGLSDAEAAEVEPWARSERIQARA